MFFKVFFIGNKNAPNYQTKHALHWNYLFDKWPKNCDIFPIKWRWTKSAQSLLKEQNGNHFRKKSQISILCSGGCGCSRGCSCSRGRGCSRSCCSGRSCSILLQQVEEELKECAIQCWSSWCSWSRSLHIVDNISKHGSGKQFTLTDILKLFFKRGITHLSRLWTAPVWMGHPVASL